MHVLIVDENLLSCTRLIEQAQVAGWTASGCGPKAALAAARRRRPDVVVVNLAAASGDAPQVIRAFKTEPDLAPIPVLAFCGHREAARRKAAADAGCDRVVSNSSVAQHLATLVRDLASEASRR